MLNLSHRHTKILLISLWTVVNLVQAFFTELAHDEAYYWVYSEYLDVGYFDHPPMIALMIKAGYLLFQNELGVRLITILFGSATLLVLDELTGRKNFLLIFSIYVAFTCFHIYGFIATPDAPLLFFTALFFLAYRKYIAEESMLNTLFISIAITALLYSKYHGILILVFVILSNPKLFTKRSFYGIIAISVVLYFPHIMWQIDHGYPSYQYHVQNRDQLPYKPLDTLNYLLGLVLIVSPLLLPFVVKSFLAFKNGGAEESDYLSSELKRSFIFVVVGFTGFFLITTFSTKPEANWNIPILIPVAIILFWYAFNNETAKKWIYRLSVATLLLFSLVRLHLMIDLVPSSIKIKDEFHLNKTWADDIEKLADGAPVVFSNSYQDASKHYFYSKKPSHSHNNAQYRRNQFDILSIVDSLQGKRVLFVANWNSEEFDTTSTSKGTLRHMFIDNYKSMNHIKIYLNKPLNTTKTGTEILLPITLVNRSSEPIKFGTSDLNKSLLVINVQQNHKTYSYTELDLLEGLVLNDSLHLTVPLKAPTKVGTYYFRVNIRTGILPETLNGDLIQLNVTG